MASCKIQWVMLRKGHGDLHKAPTKEERRKRNAKRRERDQIKFIDLRFERWLVVRFSGLCRGKAMVTYTKPRQRKKEESETLGGERGIRSSLLILDLKDG